MPTLRIYDNDGVRESGRPHSKHAHTKWSRKAKGCLLKFGVYFPSACLVQMHKSQLKEMLKEKKARKTELDRSAGNVRPLKFGGVGMAPGDEQKLRPFEYVAKLG